MADKPDWAEDFVRRVMRWEFSGEHEDTRASDVRKLFADELRARVGEPDWSTLTSEQLSMLRINSQVCSQCGRTVGESKQKYCGRGDDKDYPHRWMNPMEHAATEARRRRIGIALPAAPAEGGG